MSEALNLDTDPRPASDELTPDDPGAVVVDPANAARDGNTAPLEVLPGDGTAAASAGETPATPASTETQDAYISQSREAFRGARERGKSFLRRAGQTAMKPFVRFRRNGSTETSESSEGTPESVAQTRESWRSRASSAKERVMNRLEKRWETRHQASENARYTRMGERIQRRNERDERKRLKTIDKRADRLDNKIHKHTMSRKEYRDFRTDKDLTRERARAAEIERKSQAKQALKRQLERIKQEENASKKQEKAVDKHRKAAMKEAPKLNKRFDKVEALKADAQWLARMRADPDAHARYETALQKAKERKRQARVERTRKVGSKVIHGTGLAAKVTVGASVIGGEFAVKHAKGMAEAANNDERVQYAKIRAQLGWAAMRHNVRAFVATMGEKVTPTEQEFEEVANTGELEIAEGVEVEVDLRTGEQTESEKTPAGV